jgi:hypothetical protein
LVWNSPIAIAMGPTGRYVYIAYSTAPGNLTYHEINAGTGALFLGDIVTTGNYPTALVIARVAR